ncbi:lipopolysaccharide biosynthesis protein [uncultured Phenylobacterium sp.]|uniref:lipopolysaccharide biosynthesis protein n=1 Tax=uncultured Phenylobacterium sp. TaxID=349273 RepID=UPI0025FEB325|nr:lipopolysaccharide biosynthesis protein [uncultured Phenylobacterium sp.]
MSASQAELIAGVRPILKRVVTNAGMLLGGRLVNAVLSLGYMAIAARALGVRELGVLVLIQAFAQFLGDVVKFQSWQTIIHYGSQPLDAGQVRPFQQVLRFTLVLDLASTVLGIVVGIAGCFLFAGHLGWTAEEAPGAALFMLTIAFMVSATPVGLLRIFDRFDVMARQAALIALLRMVASVGAWLWMPNLTGFMIAFAVGTVGSWLYLAGAALGELRRRKLLDDFSWRGSLSAGMPGVWRFAWNTNLTTTLEVAFTHAATLIVGALVGPAQAAFWRVGRQVADAIAKPAKLLTPALYPELARLRSEHRYAAMWRLATQVGLLGGGLGAVLLAVSIFAGPPILASVMGAGFAPAAVVMTWQVGAAVIGILALPLEPMLISLGKPGLAVRVRLAVGALFLGILPWLVTAFGLIGAGAGLVAAAGALALGMLWFILKENGNRPVAPAPPPATAERLEGEV